MFQKSDMFKKIKSIFVIDESPEASAEMNDAQDSSGSQVTSGTTATPAAPSPIISGESGKPDQKFTDLLLKAFLSSFFKDLLSLITVTPPNFSDTNSGASISIFLSSNTWLL